MTSVEGGKASSHDANDRRGSVVFVAGASGALGRAVAAAALKRGLAVIVGSRDRNRARELAGELSEECSSGTVVPIGCDFETDAGAAATMNSAWNRLGRIDAVISSIGSTAKQLPGDFASLPYEHAMQSKFMPTVRLILAATRMFTDNRVRGRLAVVTGVGGRYVLDVHLPGGAANAALSHFVKGFGRVAASQGIALNALSPGPVASARAEAHYIAEGRQSEGRSDEARAAMLSTIPLGREAQPAEVAGVLCYLALDAPEYLVGEVVTMDGGLSRDPSR